MVFCHECGVKINKPAKHCPECGANLKGESKKETKTEAIKEPSHQTQTTIVNSGGGGFFSGLFQGAGGIIGCCVGAVIIIFIIVAIANS